MKIGLMSDVRTDVGTCSWKRIITRTERRGLGAENTNLPIGGVEFDRFSNAFPDEFRLR